MHITHFVETLHRGGLERVVLDLVATQREAGHDCHVICLFEPGSLAGELRAHGVSVDACGKRSGLDLRALRQARRRMREQHTDVLHTHNSVAHYHAVAASLGLPRRCIVNTRHGMGAGSKTARREMLYRWALFDTDAVVTVCEAARRDTQARGIVPARKSVVVRNGIRLDAFRVANRPAHDRLCGQLGLSTRTRLIGCVGRLNRAKDHASLLHAFQRVCQRDADCALVLVGEGECRNALTALAAELGIVDRVRLLGDRGDVVDLLQGLDLFVLSSVSEGYSIALLEACATALPIVATDVGGNAEIVRDGVNGRLVAARDSDALAAALSQMLEAPEHAASMGQAGHRWVLEHGSLQAMAAQYEAIYAAGCGGVR